MLLLFPNSIEKEIFGKTVKHSMDVVKNIRNCTREEITQTANFNSLVVAPLKILIQFSFLDCLLGQSKAEPHKKVISW